MNNKLTWIKLIIFLITSSALAQNTITGKVESEGEPLPFANVYISQLSKGTVTDDDGNYTLPNIPKGTYTLSTSFAGFSKVSKKVNLNGGTQIVTFNLKEDNSPNEVVISSTLKPVFRIESPVPAEVYTPTFLKKNPTPSIF